MILVRGNPHLVSLDMPSLESIFGWFHVSCNPLLSEAGFEHVAQLVPPGGADLYGNADSAMVCFAE